MVIFFYPSDTSGQLFKTYKNAILRDCACQQSWRSLKANNNFLFSMTVREKLKILTVLKSMVFSFTFSPNSCGKQLEKPNEQLFCIFKLENGGQKQANGSRDSFWPEAKPRVGMVRGCHLPA